ncbi:MAG TPA: hypothetical protein VHG93_20040 [Longimicrobium sp.]|nr:hypothetical protein [Longimicrobium sp.]
MRFPISALLALAFATLAALAPARASAQQARSVYFRAVMAFQIDSMAQKAATKMLPDENNPGTLRRTSVKDEPSVRTVVNFVAKPFDAGAVAPTIEELEAAYAYVQDWTFSNNPGASAPTFSLASLVGGGAIPSETTLILGLAEFMVERARDELVLTFLLELQQNSAQDVFIRNAMPSSYNVLRQVDALSVQSLLPAFRVAVAEDLSGLPLRLGETRVLNEMHICGNAATLIQATSLVYTRVRDIRGGTEPMLSLATLRDLDERRMQDPRVRTPFRLLGLVATDYRFYQDSLQRFVQSSPKRRIYAGFLLHDLLPQVVGDQQRTALINIMEEQQAEIEMLAQELRTLRDLTSQARTLSLDTTAVRAVVGSVLNVMRTGERFVPQEWRISLPSSSFIDDALEIHEALRQKNYPVVVAWLGQAASTYFSSASRNPNTLRYLSFASTLASARTEEDVTRALRTMSAPVGSYRLKRQQPESTRRAVTISINGYVGGGVGVERSEATDAQDEGQGGYFGAAVPLGLEVSRAMWGGSLGLYIPVVDLGTVTSQRFLGDDDTEGSPEIGFRQILAPGFYLVYGPWSDKPFSFGVGVQSVGGLRESTADERELDVWRAGLFVGMDIMLLRF